MMKILVITRNAWDDTNAIGNTLSNFFGNLDGVEFANIYFRSSHPNNDICKLYYRVTEKDILKNWFSCKKIGKRFVWNHQHDNEPVNKTAQKEKKLIRMIQKYNLKSAYQFSDFLWYSKKWINENLNEFIESFDPDVVVSFVKSSAQYFLTVRHLREKFHIPLFSWIADDEYTGLVRDRSFKKIECLKYILKESAVVCGCSEELCDYYNSVFDCHATPLYKGCDLSRPLQTKVHSPVKIVYAGNLQYGRLGIICKIADVLEKQGNVSFDIYSNTLLSESEENYFQSKTCTRYLGKQEYHIIKDRLAEADVVLHVESFDQDQILKTRYSFSTKIIDCLQSGSILLAVGPSELASIAYVKKIPGTCVIEKISDLDRGLSLLLSDIASFEVRSEEIRSFAYLHHDVQSNSKKMTELLKKAKGE